MTLMNDDKSWWQKVLTMVTMIIIIIIGKTNPVASIAYYYSTTPTHYFSLNLNVYRKDALNISFGVCVFPLSLQNNP